MNIARTRTHNDEAIFIIKCVCNAKVYLYANLSMQKISFLRDRDTLQELNLD